MIQTLTGPNDFMRNQTLQNALRNFEQTHGDMGIERFDGTSDTGDAMVGALQSLPFLTSHKLVVLREPGQQKSFAESLERVLATIPEQTTVLIVEPKLDKRQSYYKLLKKQTDMQEFAELDTPAITRWITQEVKEQGGTITTSAVRELISRTGPQQQLIYAELHKLLAYDSHITDANVQLLTAPLPQSTVFTLLDAAFAGNTKEALRIYDEQRALKVEPLAIIAMIAWQLHILAVVKTAGQRTADSIAKEAKLSPFVVRKAQGLVRKVSLTQLKERISALLTLDMRLKSEAVDADEAMRLYLLTLGQ